MDKREVENGARCFRESSERREEKGKKVGAKRGERIRQQLG